jgi:DNA-binding CsgD family transcriptional regulator
VVVGTAAAASSEPAELCVLVVGNSAIAECYSRLIRSAKQAVTGAPDISSALRHEGIPTAVLLTCSAANADIQLLAERWPAARLVQVGGVVSDQLIHVPEDSTTVLLFAALRVRRTGRRASARRTTRSPLWRLTDRELRVLRELLDGASTAQIAAALSISPHTARTHAGNVLRKLGVSTRLEAAAVARRAGLRNQAPGAPEAVA